MKKRYKVIIILQSIIIFLLICLIGFNSLFDYLINDDTEYLQTEYDNVKIYEIGHQVFFSGSDVKIQYGNYTFKTTIYNDGATLTDDNYQIVKNNDFYEVTLKGCEQQDITYYLRCQDEIIP